MRKQYVRTSRKLIALNLVLFLGFALIGLNLLHLPVYAQECPQTIALKSGAGVEGGLDDFVEVSTDNGGTWQKAYVVGPNLGFGFPYDTITTPPTQWVAISPDLDGPVNQFYSYRIKFTLPHCWTGASLEGKVFCDNAATMFLNENQIGAQPDAQDPSNFQDTPYSFSTDHQAFFQEGENVLRFRVHNFDEITALDFAASICFGVTQCEEICGSCDEGVVVVDQNVTVDLNPVIPTCSGDPDLCAYFSFVKAGTSPSTWKAIFNVGPKKLMVTNNAKITVVPGPPNGGNNKESPGIEIRSTCEVQIDYGAAVVVQSINRQAGDIFIQADRNVTINGTVSNSVAGTNGRPGEITIASCCGNILTGPRSLIQTFGSDHGGSDINLLACDRGNITINGLVDASYKGASAATINIVAFGGAVTIDGATLQGIEAGTQRRITSGVTVRSRRDPLAGKIFIQALNDVTVIGNSILNKLYPNYGAVAVKPTSTNGSSGDGRIFALSLEGKIVASNRAFDIANRFNGLNDITLVASGNIELSVTAPFDQGAADATKAVVNSQGGSAGMGGTNGLRSFLGAILIGQKAQVLANFTGTPGQPGTNLLVSCLGITNNGTVAPADLVPGDDSGVCTLEGLRPLFRGCAEFNAGCEDR